jgi:hypothetical protein
MGLGSGIRDPEKNYSGSWIRGSKRHRIPDPDPQHWLKYLTTRIKTGKNVLPPRRNGAPHPPARRRQVVIIIVILLLIFLHQEPAPASHHLFKHPALGRQATSYIQYRLSLNKQAKCSNIKGQSHKLEMHLK